MAANIHNLRKCSHASVGLGQAHPNDTSICKDIATQFCQKQVETCVYTSNRVCYSGMCC